MRCCGLRNTTMLHKSRSDKDRRLAKSFLQAHLFPVSQPAARIFCIKTPPSYHPDSTQTAVQQGIAGCPPSPAGFLSLWHYLKVLLLLSNIQGILPLPPNILVEPKQPFLYGWLIRSKIPALSASSKGFLHPPTHEILEFASNPKGILEFASKPSPNRRSKRSKIAAYRRKSAKHSISSHHHIHKSAYQNKFTAYLLASTMSEQRDVVPWDLPTVILWKSMTSAFFIVHMPANHFVGRLLLLILIA
ncbi:hypothetical protein IEQ34_003209 [Dendrobium chrysotoxum]|uniref:Uncharacterized protein n=1 Tax=Dendrobium chrysotoxum TaxID=161865 RepID=A0AAV7HGM5_DENCH|nr:hypothetical protein IEQ34_003209 [Dendrobium chrysotoxum]